MIESNSPFSLKAGIQLKIPSQAAWDLFTQPNQTNWNHAIQSFDSDFGFLTGSTQNITFKSLRGPFTAKFEVIESIPGQLLVLEGHFRHCLTKHTEQWQIHFSSIGVAQTEVTISFVLSGAFASRIWNEKKLIVNNILNLWLESLRLQSERF